MADEYNATLTPAFSVSVGSAADFRDDVNANFSIMKANADAINNELVALTSSLASVAFTGSATDIITTSSARFVTDDDITLWGQKMVIINEGVAPSIDYHIYQDSEDKTSEIQALFSGAWKPSQTSDLYNDAGFITADVVTSSKAIYIESVRAVNSVPSTPVESGSDFSVRWELPCSNASYACTADMVPTVVFNQEDSMSGDWSQVCESGDGKVYIWSKANTSTHTVEPATVKSICAIEPVEITEE